MLSTILKTVIEIKAEKNDEIVKHSRRKNTYRGVT